jgi:geranyl-CoA carboxylase alpha subunit
MNRPPRLLIANRGEIACRIIRTAQRLGWTCIAVYSQVDHDAPHVQLADQAVLLGGADVNESYLNLDRLIEVAHQTQITAIHPGYGFFSENAHFAQRCLDEGFLFVGPSPSAIELMGDKRRARLAVAQHQVPCVPGYDGEAQDEDTLIHHGIQIGFPLMVKASMGGGGKGMRLVHQASDLPEALKTATREATAAFGSGSLILEKAIIQPRHIEIQIFADQQGHIVHLGERECSLQRRNQKVIEEAPSVSISEELRQKMGATALQVAQAVQYVGAGTVEFLYEPHNDSFYFLEMNTRIQVEHPVTEEIYDVDLIEWQLDVALGHALPYTQDELNQRRKGHAIEARIYAEDPAQNYQPQAGQILAWQAPNLEGIRIESGVSTQVSPFYDPMIAKVIATASTRENACRKLQRALSQLKLMGPHHNVAYLQEILASSEFQTAQMHTRTLDETLQPTLRTQPSAYEEAVAALAFSIRDLQGHDGWSSVGRRCWEVQLRWDQVGLQERSNSDTPPTQPQRIWTLKQEGLTDFTVSFKSLEDESTAQSTDSSFQFKSVHYQRDAYELTFNYKGMSCTHTLAFLPRSSSPNQLHFQRTLGDQLIFEDGTYDLFPSEDTQASDGLVVAPMSGKILDVRCTVDEYVELHQPLLMIEAMKLEHVITAPCTGKIVQVLAQVGDQVSSKQALIEIEKTDES